MKQEFEVIKKPRLMLLSVVKDLSPEQLNHIPAGFNNNLIGYVVGEQMADWFGGLQISAVAQVRVIPVLSPDGVDAFKALTADPAASYTKLVGGDYDTLGMALWGQIDYDHRMNYTANAIT